ncbi:Phosphoglycerate mutase family protein, putative isoform 1 [Hibiscus syriacus]|uniref:Phosphoglycerate mutase family protein, putative isoform 1 n=1 Tax=Hibiscus syriacus TaxID=106335 RepID=A0A6A3ACG0_HIBSY|nr:Phosphoglycerate mutase family protein, putative isoform 1 [Hibiscus syriacus]
MNTPAAQFPYPWQRCKIVHLVRHGQAMHNVEGDKNREALLSPHLFDAQLSPLGLQQMDGEDDRIWNPDVREPEEEIAARMVLFMKWLWTRPEQEIVIVSHGIILQHILYILGNDCHQTVRSALCKRFDNCELRSVVIVDKSLGAADSQVCSPTPSGVAKAKVLREQVSN